MVEKEIMKKISFLTDLSDEMLEKVGEISQLEVFDEESILFRQNQEQNLIYMLVSGKVFLNSRSTKGESLTLDEVKPGRTFGVSALLGSSSGTFTAVVAEKSQIITVSGRQMKELFESDTKLGHSLIQKVVLLFRSRMNMHTQQLLNSLASHPGIKRV